MAAINSHLAGSFRPPKLPEGPIWDPSPGPTLESAVAAPEIEVIRSSPVKPNKIENTASDTMNSMKNAMTEDNTSSETGRPSYLGTKIPFGEWIFLICARIDANSN